MGMGVGHRVDPTRCPLCGEDNACGIELGRDTCWCHARRIPDTVLSRVPADVANRACVCERCASEVSARATRRGPLTNPDR